MKISKKLYSEIYSQIADEIMDYRVARKLGDPKKSTGDVDADMFYLQNRLADRVLKLFEVKP